MYKVARTMKLQALHNDLEIHLTHRYISAYG